jgi:hypothetical protein
MNVLIRSFAVSCVVLGLAGCQTIKPDIQITLQETATPELTLTPAISPLPTLTERLLATPAPFMTPKPSRTVDATSTSIELTDIAVSTQNAAFPESCGSFYPSVSPDGNWLADDCEEFHVVSRDGQKKVIITHAELAPPHSEVHSVTSVNWSKDSQYLYFTTHFCCADTDAYGWGGPLYRLDTQSSTWVKMKDGYFNYYSFSPTGRLLYILHDTSASGMPVQFHLLDLKSGAEQILKLQGFAQAGNLLWNEDGTRFVTVAKIGNFYIENSQFALFLVSLNDLSVTTLMPLSKHSIELTTWASDGVLTIEQDCSNTEPHPGPCQLRLYNTKSLRFINASPTP